ncbi:MAG: GTP cyclohydrolase II [Gammaproteobacteria bacterium]|nr:GTP cyclohydrolase II [Gammaproteobacteria bacterium]
MKQHIVKLEKAAQARLPTPFAVFGLQVYLGGDGKEHLALTLGDLSGPPPVVRVHSECLTGDALFSLRCDCGFQLEHAMRRIAADGRGVLLYLRQEGRGIGLANKIRAYALQDRGADTVEANAHLGFPADARDYGIAAEMLRDLGLPQVRLLTNNPRKIESLRQHGIEVVERIPIQCGRNPHNDAYLTTKADKLGHLLRLPGEAP